MRGNRRRSALSARMGRRNFGSVNRSSNRTGSSGLMSRSGFLRGAGVAAAGLGAAAVGLGGVASAHIVYLRDGACEVYPENNPEHDVPAVQEAVATYSDVTLKSVAYGTTTPTPFNFGFDTVYLFTNVTVHGEGAHASKVQGGVMTFLSVAPVHPIIENIWFDGAYFCPIILGACNGAEIRNNKITNCVAFDIGFGGPLAYGIGASDLILGAGSNTGTITVEDNYIDLYGVNYNPPNVIGAAGIGIHDFSSNVYLEVKRNTIKNAPDGIFLGSYPNGEASVELNTIINRHYQNILSGWASSGIHIIDHNYGFGVPGQTNICNNNISQALPAALPQGVDQYFHGIRLHHLSISTIQNNIISGTAHIGLELVGTSNNNVLLGNNLSNMHAKTAQVLVGPDCSDNSFEGNNFGNIVDQAEAGLKCEGQTNQFIGNVWVKNYPSWDANKGIWWLTSTSSNNVIQDPVVTGGVKPDKHLKDEGINNQFIY